MRVLFLGDIVGRTARNMVIESAAALRAELQLDFLVVNCENAAGGFGVTPQICDDLFAAGIDVLTTGNHVWDKREIVDYIEQQPRLLRPLNMAEGTPGKGVVHVTNDAGARLTVINVMANLFMAPAHECRVWPPPCSNITVGASSGPATSPTRTTPSEAANLRSEIFILCI